MPKTIKTREKAVQNDRPAKKYMNSTVDLLELARSAGAVEVEKSSQRLAKYQAKVRSCATLLRCTSC